MHLFFQSLWCDAQNNSAILVKQLIMQQILQQVQAKMWQTEIFINKLLTLGAVGKKIN